MELLDSVFHITHLAGEIVSKLTSFLVSWLIRSHVQTGCNEYACAIMQWCIAQQQHHACMCPTDFSMLSLPRSTLSKKEHCMALYLSVPLLAFSFLYDFFHMIHLCVFVYHYLSTNLGCKIKSPGRHLRLIRVLARLTFKF